MPWSTPSVTWPPTAPQPDPRSLPVSKPGPASGVAKGDERSDVAATSEAMSRPQAAPPRRVALRRATSEAMSRPQTDPPRQRAPSFREAKARGAWLTRGARDTGGEAARLGLGGPRRAGAAMFAKGCAAPRSEHRCARAVGGRGLKSPAQESRREARGSRAKRGTRATSVARLGLGGPRGAGAAMFAKGEARSEHRFPGAVGGRGLKSPAQKEAPRSRRGGPSRRCGAPERWTVAPAPWGGGA